MTDVLNASVVLSGYHWHYVCGGYACTCRYQLHLSYRFTRCQGFFLCFWTFSRPDYALIFFLNAKQAIINQSLRRIFFFSYSILTEKMKW